MPSPAPKLDIQTQAAAAAFGERLALARMRRGWARQRIADEAGISRTTLYKVEAGVPDVTLGTYLRVLSVLDMQGDIHGLAANDVVGRQLQDLALKPKRR